MHVCNYYCHQDTHACDLISEVNIDTLNPAELEDLKKELLEQHNSCSRFTATCVEWIRWAEVNSPLEWYNSKEGWDGGFDHDRYQYCYIFLVKTPGFYGHHAAPVAPGEETYACL